MTPGRIRLRERRLTVGLSQNAVARAAGVHRSTVIRWETGETTPRPYQRPALAAALAISLDELHHLLTVPTDPEPAETEMERRTFLAGAGTTTAAVLFAPAMVLQDLAVALNGTPSRSPGGQDLQPGSLHQAVSSLRHAYQQSQYDRAATQLPPLLARLDAAFDVLAGDDRRAVFSLAAHTYHVTAGVLLKLEAAKLSTVAAENSVRFALRSEDPVTVASSSRIHVHTLLSSGDHRAAWTLATDRAAALEHDHGLDDPESISVYGALLLRGAIAAATAEDAATARALLDEAARAAGRLDPTGPTNWQWTAFGADNVIAHRVAVELALGNAGTAIDNAQRIDLDRLGLPERRATVLIDTARAYAQWGKHDRALNALATAGDIAGAEVRLQRSARNVLSHLTALGPPRTRHDAAQLADRLQLAL